MTNDTFQAIRAINRPHAPDAATGEFIYQSYLLLRNAPSSFGKWARQRAFESIADSAFSWRVVGISEAALRQIALTGNADGIQRGHWFERSDRYDAIFGPATSRMERDDLLKFFFEHDTTVLIPRSENLKKADYSRWGKIIPVPDGLFTARGYAIKARKRTELPWVKARVVELDAGSP